LLDLHKNISTLCRNMPYAEFGCCHCQATEPPTIQRYSHEFYEILFFLSGKVLYTIEGRTYQLRPGDILLTNDCDIHYPQPDAVYERYLIWMQPNFIRDLGKLGADFTACFINSGKRRYRLIRPSSVAAAHLKGICEKMVASSNEQKFGSQVLTLIYLVEFLVYLNRAYFASPDVIQQDVSENEKINQTVTYINTNLTEDLSAERLCKVLVVSKSYLAHKFKEYTGFTLYQYIMKKRLVVARNLLRQGYLVMEACEKSGFHDYSNFLKAFKREFGKSPKEFLPPR